MNKSWLSQPNDWLFITASSSWTVSGFRCAHTCTLCHFSPDTWFRLHSLFTSDVTCPFSLCPLGLPDKMFGKIFVILLPVCVFFPLFFNVTVGSSHH